MRSIVLLVALCLAAPVAAAGWTYRGNNEPDNGHDTASWMFAQPDTDPNQAVRKVYFSAQAKSGEGDYNANVGFLGTRIQPAETTIVAILGFWKDCNNDGYIGIIESAALEYRVELLLDDGICPAIPPSPGQQVYPHNDGTWVRELIWIGPLADSVGAPSGNPTNFYADGTSIWGDWGLPGASPTLICPGTGNTGIRSVGAILDNVDCGNYYRGVRALNDVQDATGLPVGGWETHDIDNSDSPANVQNPVYPYLYGPAEPEGDPNEGDFRGYTGGLLGRDSGEGDGQQRERMITLVDCESDTVAPSTSVNTPGDVMDPATYPSLYESLNDTYEVATQPPSSNNGGNPCNPDSDADEGLPYSTVHVEAYSEPTFADAGRVEVDHRFEFSTGSRNFPSAAVSGTCRAGQTFTQGPLGYCAPGDLGLAAYRHDGPVGPSWRTNTLINMYSMTTREQGLKDDAPDFGAWYASFYAKLGPGVLSIATLPGGAPGVYGSEACGGETEGVHNFWNCDPQAWIQRCNDTETAVLPELCYRVGFEYHLRDVDCWDGTLARGSGIHASLVDTSDSGPCLAHPENEAFGAPALPVG